MKQYQPKFQKCPYKTSDGKCVHKGMSIGKTKRKQYCGYPKPEKCRMYMEWVEQRKASKDSFNPLLQLSHNESEENKHGAIR